MILTIISYPSQLEAVFEVAAARFYKLATPDFVVERCQEPAEVPWLARLWKRRGARITRVDLLSHGAGGRFSMGDELLFAADGTGYRLAKQLGAQLTTDAHVRLLGCRTAEKDAPRRLDGRTLLRDLAQQLGRQRVVWGTTAYLGPRHFGPNGFRDDLHRVLVRFPSRRLGGPSLQA